jgi:DNA-binding IclR family transcriptional regulator
MENPNAIEKTLLIMEEFTKRPHVFTAKTLSERLEISKPTVHRILNILEENNFIRKVSGNGEYAIGYKAYSVGMSYAFSMDEFAEIRNIVEEVSAIIGQQVGYGILEGLCVVSLYESKLDDPRDPRMQYRAGETFYSINCGCYGKVLMAYSYPLDELRKIVPTLELKQISLGAIMDHQLLLKDYEKILERGYATSEDEYMEGVFGIGAPTFSKNGKVHGCIALGALKTRTNLDNIPFFVEEIKKGAKKISRILL